MSGEPGPVTDGSALQEVADGLTDGLTDGLADGLTDGLTEEPTDGLTEHELLTAVNTRGDRGALAMLFVRDRGYFLRVARRFEGRSSSADDIVSETIAKLLGRLSSGNLAPIHSFRPYFVRAMHNTGVDMERRVSRETSTDDAALVPLLVVDDSSEALAEAEIVTAAFGTLRSSWREVLWQTEVLGRTTDEVSRNLGLSKGALAILKFRAKEGLRQAYLAQHLEATDDPACRAVLELLPRYVRGKLDGVRLQRVEAHLAVCASCSATLRQLRTVSSNMAAVLAPALVLMGAEEPVRRRVGGWLGSQGLRRAAAAAAAVTVAGVLVLETARHELATDAPTRPSMELSTPARSTPTSAPTSAPTTPTATAGPAVHRTPAAPRRSVTAAASASATAATVRPSVSAVPTPSPGLPPVLRPVLADPVTTLEHRVGGSIAHLAVDITGPGADRAVLVLTGAPLTGYTVPRRAWRCSTLQAAPRVRVSCTHRAGASLRFSADLVMAPAATQVRAAVRLGATGQTYSIVAHP